MLVNDATSSIGCLDDYTPVSMSEIRMRQDIHQTNPASWTQYLRGLHEILLVLTVNTSLETAHVPAAFKCAVLYTRS